MHRYLLFDSGCSICAELAQAVEQATHGGLEARSLRDPAMQRLLAQARPHWRWQPTLLEVEGERVRAFTGLALGLHLMMKLGPRRTLRLVRLTGHFGVSLKSKGSVDLGRRRFLEQLAAATLVLGWSISLGSGRDKSSVYSRGYEGEIYEGFLLLPDGAPLPSFVKCVPAPILCQTDGQSDPAWLGQVIKYDSLEELRRRTPFPLYVPGSPPYQIHFVDADVIQFTLSGDIFMVMLNFGSEQDDPLLKIWASPFYPRPYPIWPVRLPSSPEEPIYPEKVIFTPSPGVMRPTFSGLMIDWIQYNVLYTLVTEHDPRREAAEAAARSLIQI